MNPAMNITGLLDRAELTVLGGPATPGRQVTGIRMTVAAAGTGDLVVLLDPDRTSWRLDAELSKAVEAGAAALMVPGTDPLPSSTVLLAERLATPVLGCPGDPLETAVRLAVQIASSDVDVARRVLAAHQALDIGTPTLEEMRRLAGTVVRAEITVLARDGALLLGPPIGEQVRVSLPVRQRLADGGVAVPVLAPDARSAELWLVVAGTAGAEEVLAVAAAAAQRSLALRRLELERDARRSSALLGELLQAGDDPGPSLRRRAAEAGWRLDGWHTGIRIDVSRPVDVVTLTGDIVATLSAESVEAVVVAEDGGWVAWVSTDVEPDADAVNRLALLVRQAQRRMADLDPLVGMARPHHGPGGIARSLSEARDAARLAAARAETGKFVHVDRLGLAQLLLAWTRTDTFVPAARSLLAALAAEPGDLTRTLTVYLDTESSLIDTAAVLGVHRNTVTRRIDKIERLLGVDLADADTRLALHLACRVAAS
ncbi:PucR family transcriptional regulator [Nonomuraea sp. NPDC004354]